MNGAIEIYNNLGILNRTITNGKEIYLVYDYIEYRKRNFFAADDRKLAAFLESKVGQSYPNIVFVEYNPYNYCDWNFYRENLKIDDYKILYHVYSENGINADLISLKLGFSENKVISSVQRLLDAKLLKQVKGHYL